MEKHNKIANLYVATLKAISLIHQHNHWTTKGEMFYGDHLLFERIYNSALENLDLAAEKFMGLFGEESLNFDLQTELLNKILTKYKNLEGSPVEMSLAIEKDFLKFAQASYNEFKEADVISLGLDDAIMSISNKREEAVYLLQQILNS